MTIDFEHLGGVGALVDATVGLGAAAALHFVSAALLLIVGWWLASRVERSVARVLAAQSRIDPTLSANFASAMTTTWPKARKCCGRSQAATRGLTPIQRR